MHKQRRTLVVVDCRPHSGYLLSAAETPLLLVLDRATEENIPDFRAAAIVCFHEGNGTREMNVALAATLCPLVVFGGGIPAVKTYKNGNLIMVPRGQFELCFASFVDAFLTRGSAAALQLLV